MFERRVPVMPHALAKSNATTIASSLVGNDPPCRCQEPRQRVVWKFVETAPCDEKDVGDDVVCDRRTGPPPRVCAYRAGMGGEETLESGFRVHAEKCPATAELLQGERQRPPPPKLHRRRQRHHGGDRMPASRPLAMW